MIQQETYLKVADNNRRQRDKNAYAFWAAPSENTATLATS
jgi:hypothetical protein